MDLGYLISKEEVLNIVNKLFIYTDTRNWDGLLKEVFSENVFFDMSSLGGDKPATIKATQITSGWEQGLKAIDSVHHQAGMYNVDIKNKEADVFCYGVAYHHTKNISGGNTRIFVGTYNLHFSQIEQGWRIDKFKFNAKFTSETSD